MNEQKAKDLLKELYKFAIENGIDHLSVVIMPKSKNIKGWLIDYTQGANYKEIILDAKEVEQ